MRTDQDGKGFEAARYAGLPQVVAGWVVDPRLVLACLCGVYATVCGLALMPGWLTDGHAAIALAGILATATALILLRVRSLRQRAAHVLLAVVPIVVGGLTLAGQGGVDSAAFAYLTVFVSAYAAMFFGRRAFTAHLLWCLTTSGGALTATDPGNPENGYFVIVLAITMTSTSLLLSRLVRRVWFAATHDPLTGLLNEQGLRAATAAHERAVMIVLDIDGFSRVNDALGRDGGDDLLRAVAHALSRLWPGAAIARLSADVFAVTPPSPDRLAIPIDDAALEQMMRGIGDLHGNYRAGGIDVDVTITAGAARRDDTGVSPTVVLRRAVAAAAAAKHDAREWYLWSPAMDRERRDELELQADLRGALRRGELVVHYQPQVASGTRRITAVEALVRWQHPRRGLIGPGAFLPAAERSPLITDITTFVLAEATTQAARWLTGGTPVVVAVNLSARSLTDDALPQRIAAQLTTSGLPAHLLTVEVTETAVIAQPEQAHKILSAIRALGAHISIDDFGTGHTSLALLTDLPIDELKLDRRFVAAALHHAGSAAIVATVADLARRLGLHTVAEGVEDDATSSLLDTLGYDSQQGFLHARPQPAATIDDLLRANTPITSN